MKESLDKKFLGHRLWYIRFEDEGIVHRNMLGKILKLHLHDKSVIRLVNPGDMLSAMSGFLKHGVIITLATADDTVGNEYTMEPTPFYKGISWFCVIVSIVFLVMSVYSSTWIGFLFFGVWLICSIIAFLMKLNAKIVVSPKGVVVKSFLKKDRGVAYSKIKYIKRKISDNAQITYLYSDEGLEFKYSELYKNAAHFESVISRYKNILFLTKQLTFPTPKDILTLNEQ